jgi:transposase-like protein
MAKIPQCEWDVIVKRYSQGESISSIARHYDCTPPAIHYILKRNNQRTAVADQHSALLPTPAKPESAQPVRIDGNENGRSASALVARKVSRMRVTLPPRGYREQKSDRDFAPVMRPLRAERSPTTGRLERSEPQRIGRASALGAGLDAELRADIEIAIQAFRSSFDTALAENGPTTRKELRQAASDLMRAAARTTIVLDRLNTDAKPAAPRGERFITPFG